MFRLYSLNTPPEKIDNLLDAELNIKQFNSATQPATMDAATELDAYKSYYVIQFKERINWFDIMPHIMSHTSHIFPQPIAPLYRSGPKSHYLVVSRGVVFDNHLTTDVESATIPRTIANTFDLYKHCHNYTNSEAFYEIEIALQNAFAAAPDSALEPNYLYTMIHYHRAKCIDVIDRHLAASGAATVAILHEAERVAVELVEAWAAEHGLTILSKEWRHWRVFADPTFIRPSARKDTVIEGKTAQLVAFVAALDRGDRPPII